MTFANPKPLGYATGEKLPSTHVNTVFAYLPYAVDGNDGGTYTPAAPISIAGVPGLDLAGTVTIGTSFSPAWALREWVVSGALPSSGLAYGGGWHGGSGRWFVAGGTDKLTYSADGGLTWINISGAASTVLLLDACVDIVSNAAIAAGSSATAYRITNLSSVPPSVGTVTLPGTTPVVYALRAAGAASLMAAVGVYSGGTTAYIATSMGGGSSWTQRTAPAGMSAMTLHSLALSTSGSTMIAAASTAHTKLARSADSGATWAECSGTLASDVYHVTYNLARAVFVAVGVTGSRCYTSTDGNTWTLVSSAVTGGLSPGGTQRRCLASYGSALALLLVRATSGESVLRVSTDGGVSWVTAAYFERNPGGIIDDQYGIQLLVPAGASAATTVYRNPRRF